MGKILFTNKKENGDVNYIAGIVTFVNEGYGEMEGKVVNCGMTLSVWDPEKKESQKKYLSISFFNNENRPLRDRFVNAKVGAGDFILVTTGTIKELTPAKDGTPRIAATGFAFSKSGITYVEAGDKKYNVVIGTARRLRDVPEKSILNVNVPVSVFDKTDKSRKDVWYSISFADNDSRKLYKPAKAITEGTPIACLCGEVRENGNFKNLNAFQMIAGRKREEGAIA